MTIDFESQRETMLRKPIIKPHPATPDATITPARKFRMLLHTNPTRE